MRKRLTAIFFALLCVFTLAGCKKKTLEQKIKKSDLEELNQQAYNQYVKPNPWVRDIRVEIEGNTLYYKAYFAQELNDAQILEIKAGSVDLIDVIFQIKDGIEKEVGVRPDKVVYIYYGVNDEIIHQVEASWKPEVTI